MNNSQFSSQSNFFDYHQDYIAKMQKENKKKSLKGSFISVPNTTYFTLCQNDYSVQSIKGKRFVKSRVQYLISWESFPGQDTWEYIENLQHIKQMIMEYEKKIKLTQIQKEAQGLGITRVYDYDFSSRGKTLVMISQQKNQSSANIVPQKSYSEQYSANTYISSSPNQSIYASLQNVSRNNQPQVSSSASNWSLDLAQLDLNKGNANEKQSSHTSTFKDLQNRCISGVIQNQSLDLTNQLNQRSIETEQKAPIQRPVIIRPYLKKTTSPSNSH